MASKPTSAVKNASFGGKTSAPEILPKSVATAELLDKVARSSRWGMHAKPSLSSPRPASNLRG